ncbi:DUF1788 domain-containing protein [Glaciimonas sp. CA11.2]|uniref:DUF1788 domain-containing protein n=1 Tax=Glaciimonas sp. CA11.2 TaxID=3048601 RepID=UPI002AB55DEA|nr:DUF1788 domain-containing protein [Glaciimonas sp. CA11.2]MDY7545493.1 DUF1788 domain-containing protein [Glaciimonas sp. CA11.2]MEB0163069.1 DUF1788 domain-containing protein [Glaciimonas sp. CA11.2]
MTKNFEERLNQILTRLTSPELLKNQGLGNEIGFWIFDYPAERELEMRAFRKDVIEPNLARMKPELRFASVNLFDFVIELLEERGLLEKAFAKQRDFGDEALLASLRPILKEDKLAPRLVEKTRVEELDLLILHGVGAVYPLLRTHTLLSALHPYMRETPLLMLYPGIYDGMKLKLFNQLTDDNYYRAFSLVS